MADSADEAQARYTRGGGFVRTVSELFENNRRWAAKCIAREPDFFAKLKAQQAPEHLWIGCSDSRVPANEIVGLAPGELFVHRNVANVVVHTDLNCLSVLQYAIEVLRVSTVIICGHYGCGGVRAALEGLKLGLIDNWLRHVQDVHAKHRGEVDSAGDMDARANRLCELNVIEQAVNVCKTTVVQEAWERGQPLTVHGWIYGLDDGRLRDIGFTATGMHDVRSGRATALSARPDAPVE
jgi:carbonic anhydrase